ncbi:hypothetical protein A9Q84_15925 [Halobacteriovorax marinus]|uniref:rRNA (guanine-N(2)-)-methyltransferase n=1 Tax=Halobacteriovorax marinus TaxID=97084 RepID=A0A1Y5F4C5_9BACT|nr:hypothetical protein A9Q84_15925 [Halobacteriovorax marinus]
MQSLMIHSKIPIDPVILEILTRVFDVQQCSEPCDSGLIYDEEGLFYKSLERGHIQFSFSELWQSHSNKKYTNSKEPLAKALGIKRAGETHVWDLTCGSGKDSILILKFGAKVTAFERNPSVAALLLLAQTEFESKSFEVHYGQASKHLKLLAINPPDVFYYDPMYPEEGKKKTALPRKEMQVFRELVGRDEDIEDVFDWAKRSGVKRFVIKRGVKSPTLKSKPSSQFVGKTARYDLYVFP